MSDEDHFLAAVLAAPREDTLRLVFADWLDERAGPGDADRAEFIRLGVANPEAVWWAYGDHPDAPRRSSDRAAILFWRNWKVWQSEQARRLGDSPLARWLDRPDCQLGYRRRFVSLFYCTQQVILDAWHDLFLLGPVDEVQVRSLWHFGTVSSLQMILDRSSTRVLKLLAAELREDCVERLQQAADWFRRLDRVELRATNARAENVLALRQWLAADPSLRHVSFA